MTYLTATRAAEAGVAGIIVSNHGARQLDYAPATISVLEEVILISFNFIIPNLYVTLFFSVFSTAVYKR